MTMAVMAIAVEGAQLAVAMAVMAIAVVAGHAGEFEGGGGDGGGYNAHLHVLPRPPLLRQVLKH